MLRLHRWAVVALLSLLFSATLQAQSERQLYREAMAKIRAGQHSAADRIADRLQHYILHPYLEYHLLNARLNRARPSEIIAFLNAHSELPAARHLRLRWLKRLGQARQWQTFLQHYIDNSDPELTCYYLRARYGTGQRSEALALTTQAWIQPNSQPKACDPIFEVWRGSEHFDEHVVWQRVSKALPANEVSLARYLLRYLDELKEVGNLFYQAHVRPDRLKQVSRYGQDTDEHRTVLAHALPRLARRNPELAAQLWPQYASLFSPEVSAKLTEAIIEHAAAEGVFPATSERSVIADPQTMKEIAESAVAHQRWDEVIYWIEQLPAELRTTPFMQYWLARALAISTGDQERAQLTLAALSDVRHYYGFWAAQRLGLPGKLNADPVFNQRTSMAQLARNPHFARSLELFAVEDGVNGRREWYAGLNTLSPSDQKVAAELALSRGRLPLTIRTANHAGAENALHLRFPVAHTPQYRASAHASDLPVPLLLAVTRQESAWDHRARSVADARGLMQMLPSTARLVARRHHLRAPSSRDLYDPAQNIVLGSHHLSWLIRRFDGQEALAFAAYNAGEHRVDRWISDADGVPLDVWVEGIPFRETRNYVKNALAFQQVYAQLLTEPLPFIQSEDLYVRKR